MLNFVYHDTQDEAVYQFISLHMQDRYHLFESLPDTIEDDWIESIAKLEHNGKIFLIPVAALRQLWTRRTSGSRARGCILYRAVDSDGATIDFLLSAKCNAAAAERFLTKALGGENHTTPRVINTDKHAAYPPAIAEQRSSAGSTRVSIFDRSGELGARSPATKQFI